MTRAQQRRLNAMCGDLSRQVEWFIRAPNGENVPAYLDRDDWRHIFSGLQLGARYALNPESPERFITLAASSLKLSERDASEVIERMFAFGNARGVVWTDPKERALMAQYEQEARQ